MKAIDTTIIKQETVNRTILTIEKRGDKLMFVKKNGQSVSFFTDMTKAEIEFAKQKEIIIKKGGENTMGKKDEDKQKEAEIAESLDESLKGNSSVDVPEDEEVDKALASQDVKLSVLDDAYFKEKANIGLEDVDSEDLPTPTLTLIQSNSRYRDRDGRPYAPGSWYYKATQQVIVEPHASLLVFMKQYMDNFTKTEKEMTYMFLGALLPDLLPFKMYLRGYGMGAAKQLLGQVKALRKPMFALDVILQSERKENNFGEFYIPRFVVNEVVSEPDAILQLEELAVSYSNNRQKIQEEAAKESSDIPFS